MTVELDPRGFVTRPEGRRGWVREGRRALDANREPPGHYATFSREGLSASGGICASPRRSAPRARAIETRAAVRDAVRREMVSDLALGAFLSGGLDSEVERHRYELEPHIREVVRFPARRVKFESNGVAIWL